MKKITLLLMAITAQINFAQNVFPISGNVGIGTTNPLAKLEVNNGNILVRNLLSNIDNESSIMIAHSINFNNYDTFGTSIRTITQSAGYNTYGMQLFTQESFLTGQTEKVRILGNGNVGIGIFSPNSKLDVLGEIKSYNASFGQSDVETSTKNYVNFSTNSHGSVLMSSNLYFSGNDDLKIVNTHGTMSGGAIVLPGNGRPNQGAILFYTSTSRSVLKDESYSGSISMAITGSGNVGIGIKDPNNKLDVNGTIHSKEVKVDMTGWSDFVFKKEYNLPTLEEVEKHIVEKGHLENIPSEVEVLKNGINLGEMNARLLQKIEELTLYMIEQEKRNNLQSQEIDLLKKENQKFQLILDRVVKLENQSK